MKASSIVTLGLLAMVVTACGSDKSGGNKATAGSGSSLAGGAGSNAGGSGGDTSSAGGAISIGIGGAATWVPSPMPLISRGVPAFASGSANTAQGPEKSNDDQPGDTWVPDKLPAWIAYDLSGVPAAKRGQVLIAWYAPHAGSYLLTSGTAATDQVPVDYTIETNAAPGGGSPPADGWSNVATVTGNARNAREHLADLGGGNWVRMTVTKETGTTGAAFDLDVHSAPNGASDCWLLMGDSITFISTGYAFDDLPSLVNQIAMDRWPAVIDAAIGGTSTVTAQTTIDDALKYFPGRFVTLNYGTNNHASDFDMEPLIQKVLDAGKIPAIPHMPSSDSAQVQAEGPPINQAIDALYAKYPEILHGPDFWAFFMGRTDLIPSGDIHPNAAGQEELRKQWAQAMTR